jgi:hypothetical protein
MGGVGHIGNGPWSILPRTIGLFVHPYNRAFLRDIMP